MENKTEQDIYTLREKEEANYWSVKRGIEDQLGKSSSDFNNSEMKAFFQATPKTIERFRKEETGKFIKPSKKIFLETKKIISKYLDTSELNYNLLTVWTLGTYLHQQFETFPLLTLIARKQSGKTRTLKLVSSLSQGSDGSTSTSVTETHLFRHKGGSMFFDEMESISSKEKGALRETINAVYKKGNKIVRYKESKVDGVKEYVEENFFPFYPLGLANIKGFGEVLTDRSLQLILQRSSKEQTRLIEDFSTNPDILKLKETLGKLDVEIPKGLFSKWNEYIQNGEFEKELEDLFESIKKTNITGRPFEIFFPLFFVGKLFGVLPEMIKSSEEYLKRQEGEYVDNMDDLLQEFMDKNEYKGYVNQSKILSDFKSSLEDPPEWINPKWMSNALKRLGLVESKRIVNGRVQLIIIPTISTISTTPTTPTTPTNKEEKVGIVGVSGIKGMVEEKPKLYKVNDNLDLEEVNPNEV